VYKKYLIVFLAVAVVTAPMVVLLRSKSEKYTIPAKKEPALVQITTADSGKWVGFAPFYLAKAKGFDVQNGVDLKIEKVGSSDARRQMLASGQVDFLTPTIDGAVFNANAGMDVKIIMAYDTSNGGDGIVSSKTIVSPPDLKGKKVGATKGFTNYFFLKYIMNQNGLTDSDLTIVDMPDDLIASALLAGELDAGAVMEPAISQLVAQGDFKLLVSSKDTPGVVTDIVLARTASIREKEAGLLGVMRAWLDALAYWDQHRQEANSMMAKEYGMTLEEFEQAIESVRWLGKQDNLDYFGTESAKGQIYNISQQVIDVAKTEGMITNQVSPDTLIDGTLLTKLQ